MTIKTDYWGGNLYIDPKSLTKKQNGEEKAKNCKAPRPIFDNDCITDVDNFNNFYKKCSNREIDPPKDSAQRKAILDCVDKVFANFNARATKARAINESK